MLGLEKANTMVSFADKELYGDLSKDPIGLVTLLFFFLRNGLESSAVDNMIAQANAWIDEKLNEHNFTRFLDREFVSAIFGFYALRSFKRLRTTVKTETLNEMLSNYIEDDHFFHNYTYSVMIALSVSDLKIAIYKALMEWISRKFEDEAVFNDAKKLVFTAMLFHQTNREEDLLRLVKNCYDKLVRGTIPHHDRIYYAWIIWNHRKLLSEQALSKLTQLVASSLENFVRQWREEELEKGAKEMYGRDKTRFKPSKIALGVYMDLSRNFASDTMIVSKKELARTPLLTRLGSLISVILLIIDIGLLYFSLSYGVIVKIPTELMVEKLATIVSTAIIDIIVMLFVILIAVVSLSLLWDTAVKGYVNTDLIINNMKNRVGDWIKGILLGDIIIGILVGFIIGI